MTRVIVLGSTGSIGIQALEIIGSSDELQVVGLSCGRNATLLAEQAKASGCGAVAVADEEAAARLDRDWPDLTVRTGNGAAAQMVREVEADLVLNAIVGFAGLESTIASLERGSVLALANKESLVCAGSLVGSLAKKHGAKILPVDSEHSALFQLIEAAGTGAVDSLVITGSGGPFRGWDRDRLGMVTREEALDHPTWSMGEKITIDSATLMNKGLEVIEAHHLFGLAYEDIEVVIHPQSIVHAMVRMSDGALLAHMGNPDMRVPISWALHYPKRPVVDTEPLSLVEGLSLGFEPPDEDTFPAIGFARQAGSRGDAVTCSLNAVNEVAVRAFLEGSLTFLGISEVVEEVLNLCMGDDVRTYEDAVAIDQQARAWAAEICSRH